MKGVAVQQPPYKNTNGQDNEHEQDTGHGNGPKNKSDLHDRRILNNEDHQQTH
jgi:hypothetical protein